MARLIQILGGLVAAALATAIASGGATPMPNLAQRPPGKLIVTPVANRWHLGFLSSVANVGTAPLLVTASRASRSAPTMTAWQVVGRKRVGRVGVLHYVTDPTHAHWHLQPFETYELRRLSDASLVAVVQKEGFCLSDSAALPNAGPRRHVALCGKNRPDLLRLGEGISPGWMDIYGPEKEGQFVDVTSVPAGRYLLVNRVNAGRAIRETRYDDDVAATAIDLEWPGGAAAAPTVTVIGTCTGAAACATLGVR